MAVLSPLGGALPLSLSLSQQAVSGSSSEAEQLITPPQRRLKPTRLIFAVWGGDQFVEEDVGVAAANLAGRHGAHPAHNTQYTLH